MAIQKLLNTPNEQVCEYHEVRSAQIDYTSPGNEITYTVYSYSNYADKVSGAAAKWAWHETGQLTTADLVDIETSITTINKTPFFGGTIVNMQVANLQREKIVKYNEINKLFNTMLSAALEVSDIGTFDADKDAVSNVVAAIEIMKIKAANGDTSPITWTMYDNTTKDLSLVDLQTVLVTGAFRDSQLRAIKTQLREAITAAQTSEELAGVLWPQ